MVKYFILFIIFLLIIIFTPQHSYSLNGEALWRSAILPGWGQYYKQDVPKAYFVGGGFLACMTFDLVFWSSASSKYLDYSNATSDYDSKWDDYESAKSLNNIVFYLWMGSYLYNLVDAAFLGKSMVLNQPKINIQVANNNTKLGYNYSY